MYSYWLSHQDAAHLHKARFLDITGHSQIISSVSTFAKVVRMVVLMLQVAVSVNEVKTSLGFGIDIKKIR